MKAYLLAACLSTALCGHDHRDHGATGRRPTKVLRLRSHTHVTRCADHERQAYAWPPGCKTVRLPSTVTEVR